MGKTWDPKQHRSKSSIKQSTKFNDEPPKVCGERIPIKFFFFDTSRPEPGLFHKQPEAGFNSDKQEGHAGSDVEGHVDSEMGGFQTNISNLKATSSSHQYISMLSRPRSELENGQQPILHSFPTQDTINREGELFVNPHISEAWLSGYRNGLGVASQVYCWGCRNYGYIVPAIVATF